MHEIYLPENNIEAYLVQGLLESEGVECEIRGEYLPGAAGELPAGNTVSLWVHEGEVDAAKAVLKRYEAGEFAAE